MKLEKKPKPYVLILAGGSGTRLWPLSRTYRPKQLLSLYSQKSLIAETYDRACKLTNEKNIFIGTNQSLKKAIRKEFKIPKKQFLLEPVARNTAPIIALFCSYILHHKKNENAPIIVLSADHFISPIQPWLEAIESTYHSVHNKIWCMGLKPTRPETGYGYIETLPKSELVSEVEKNFENDLEQQREKNEPQTICQFQIKSFREKPDKNTAIEYLNTENYFWNLGSFVFSAKYFRSQLKKINPKILEISDLCIVGNTPKKRKKNIKKTIEKHFPKMPNISVDYAVMEKCENMGMVTGNFQWDDVGAFDSLSRLSKKDENGNWKGATTKYQAIDSKNNIIYTGSRLALLGVENLVIAESDGVLLIAHKDELHRIKEIREKIPPKFH